MKFLAKMPVWLGVSGWMDNFWLLPLYKPGTHILFLNWNESKSLHAPTLHLLSFLDFSGFKHIFMDSLLYDWEYAEILKMLVIFHNVLTKFLILLTYPDMFNKYIKWVA